MGVTLLYYDSRELLSLLYDLRCDHNYNVVYAARRIIYGRQTRLGFVIVNIFFYQNISIRRIIDRIFTSTSPINTRVAHPPAIEICSNTCTHTSYPTKLPIAHTYLRGATVRNVPTIPHKCQLHRNDEKPFWIGTSNNFMTCIENM